MLMEVRSKYDYWNGLFPTRFVFQAHILIIFCSHVIARALFSICAYLHLVSVMHDAIDTGFQLSL